MRELTENKAKKLAKENVKYTLDELIDPSDITDNASKWENIDPDVLDRELWESVSVMRSENQSPFDHIAYDLAMSLCMKDMPRVNMDHMSFSNREKAVRKGYWPNKMDKYRVMEILSDYSDQNEHFYEYMDRAWEIVGAGIYEGMDPRDN